jgi:predicted signal transduction protein with EAL and GGDEF domain
MGKGMSGDDVRGVLEETGLAPAIIGLAQTLRLRTIAEGIQQPEQLVQLQAIGCQAGRGFLLGRPLTSQATEQLLGDLQPGEPPATAEARCRGGRTTPTAAPRRQAEAAAT